MAYAVIKIDQIQGDGYVERVHCVALYDDEESAQQYIESIKEKHNIAFGVREEYIKQFVDGIDVPKMNMKEWEAFQDKYFGFRYSSRSSEPEAVRKELVGRLKQRSHSTLLGFNSPKMPDETGQELHIMEIKREQLLSVYPCSQPI